MKLSPKHLIGLSVIFLVLIGICFPIPTTKISYSTILLDDNQQLLGAVIADDGQWRFPKTDSISTKFEKALLTFEDKNFRSHCGIDILAICRATYQNIKAGKITSGGSTITMQLIRQYRQNKSRNISEKIVEIFFAIKIEWMMSKDEILSEYIAHAPYGGNVVGINAASWRYFGREPNKMSWAENALLAVLPNQPSLIHLARNRHHLMQKRNRLLMKLFKNGEIDKSTYQLSLLEQIPSAPKPIPQIAPHLLQYAILMKKKGHTIHSTINSSLQQKVQHTIDRFNGYLKGNSVHNGAAIVLDTENGNIISYVGNTKNEHSTYDNFVDINQSSRSYGSLLKPILYADMLEEGLLMPDMLVADCPLNINGYSPQNFNKTYEGSVTASQVLSQSLNVPSVKMLEKLGTYKFLFVLNQLGLNHLDKNADHYGLSIILGGGEATMLELTSMYGNMVRKLNDKNSVNFIFDKNDTLTSLNDVPLSKSSIWFMAEAIAEAKRPGANGGWEIFNSSQKIAWKTGTSYGFRDAWSIGFTKKYVVGVWFGNATGEGRAGLTGIGTAAPAMFEIFEYLDYSNWFEMPTNEMTLSKVCTKSGHKASEMCNETVEKLIPKLSDRTQVCPYHIKIWLDKSGKYRVNSDCEQISSMIAVNQFVLPPIQEWYYKKKNANYIPLPMLRNDCQKSINTIKLMEVIYPKKEAKLYIPTELNGNLSKIVLQATHRKRNAVIFWHIDEDVYLGKTNNFHQLECFVPVGRHKLTLVDANGNTEELFFTVLANKI